ncbi:hypothetical protein EJ08DRAFT_646780 [Tothia fuscella]|uniref:Protein kinase domain-containing protein n=1 Tax=Tothia fuscella TaxID=1048955 RepID=A0A9P4NXS2_9PEZI|nr:hypothetical protein EJ08DRAFT_646780 [Tothia fuscella]
MALPDITEGSPKGPEFEIPGWETTPEGFILYMRVRSAWLNIHIQLHNFQNSPIAQENVRKYKPKLSFSSDEDELWDYVETIASHFLPALQKLAPVVNHVGKFTLADLQSRQYYKCELEFFNELPRPGPISPMDLDEEGFLDEYQDLKPPPIQSPFPRFQLSEVEVAFSEPSTVFDIIPETVYVKGVKLFWKPSWILQESRDSIEKYRKIQQSGLSTEELATSRLYGVVVDGKGTLRGQLYHWIEFDAVLEADLVEKASSEVREKWASQIKSTVSTLHELDVVWGDVKAENVVIDKKGDAVVIDLEGGATKGWVDKDKMGTKEGDLQGLDRLVDYLLSDTCHLRTREMEVFGHGECGAGCVE